MLSSDILDVAFLFIVLLFVLASTELQFVSFEVQNNSAQTWELTFETH